MGLKLYNTLTRKKESFQPIDPANVRMYVCGPTVYQRIHIGNARPLIVFDVLFRLLRHLYGEQHVTYARNITDIDDKIIAQAEKNGESIESLTERTTRDFLADADALGCLRPTHQPRATEHIPGMVAMIARLIEQGHAYAADGHVLFNVPSMPAYGRLSGRNRDDQIAGARVEVAPYKRDPADFVLWKPSTPDQPGWDSPWGRGRPGWHIECSAMSEHFLGAPFDIHGGGLDLIFPHHENEIAQSCCAHDIDRMANYWMHNGFVDMGGEKMSKSLGNVLSLRETFSVVPGEAVALWLLRTHYRQPIDLTEKILQESKRRLDRFYKALYLASKLDKRTKDDDSDVLYYMGSSEAYEATNADSSVINALEDDLNTPKAISSMGDSLNKLNDLLARGSDSVEIKKAADKLRTTGSIMGLLQDDPKSFLRWRPQYVAEASLRAPKATASGAGYILHKDSSDEEIDKVVRVRDDARANRRYADADRIRASLERIGVVVEDKIGAPSDWRRA